MRTLVASLLAARVPFVHFDRNGVALTLSSEARLLLGNAHDHALEFLADIARALIAKGPDSESPQDFDVRAGGLTLHVGAVALLGVAAQAEVLMVLSLAPSSPARKPLDERGLTVRERQVAEYVAAGLPSTAIARVLGISVHTVRRHTERVFSKTGVNSRTQLTRIIIENSASNEA